MTERNDVPGTGTDAWWGLSKGREAEGSQLGQVPLNTPCFLGSTGLAGHWGACVPQGISEDKGLRSMGLARFSHNGDKKGCGHKGPEGTLEIYSMQEPAMPSALLSG